MTISERIKELRKKEGDTLKSLAAKINYDFSNLSKVERGLHEPSLPLIRKIAEVYNVRLDYFLDSPHYTPDEQEFMLNLDAENIQENYRIFLDGKELSDHELELAIEIIRKLRSAISEKKS